MHAPSASKLPELSLPRGATPLFACSADQRFSYCLYIPLGIHQSDTAGYPLLVTVHGTGRRALEYRDAFAEFAEAHGCVILAPLFPGGIVNPWEVGSYKLIRDGDLRYDLVLLSMIAEAARAVPITTGHFLLHGFSGGGQFAHRFFYLHPGRLLGLSVGAPGAVTLLDDQRDWWVGVKNVGTQFGTDLDLDAMRRVPVQLIIGANDADDVTIQPGERRWMEGANNAGTTRIARLSSLQASFERHAIAAQQEIVPGIGHDAFALLDPVKAFFANLLNQQNDRTLQP